jgi:DNA (cytosine-5)-methyltransferase 1
MTPRKLRILDLFSGIGGFSLGLERTGGFETAAFCEIEPFPRRVLAKHWPGVPIYGDVATADFREVGPVGLVTAGFPCQDISLAGKGAGLAGERSGLYWNILRTVRMVGRPKLLLENVAALLNRGMGAVLGSMAEIGYDAEWHCIPASYVGAWHKRDRVWILAHPNEIGREGGTDRPILGQPDLSREPLRGFAKWPGRPALPPSRFCSASDGIPHRVDAIAAAGNSVVPQIPEMIGRAILEAEAAARRPQ